MKIGFKPKKKYTIDIYDELNSISKVIHLMAGINPLIIPTSGRIIIITCSDLNKKLKHQIKGIYANRYYIMIKYQ